MIKKVRKTGIYIIPEQRDLTEEDRKLVERIFRRILDRGFNSLGTG